ADIVNINVPAKLECILVYPHISIKTADAREILPRKIDLSQAVKQWGNIGGLISGFFKEDYELISHSIKGWIVEPVRSKLIPGFDDVKNTALDLGALGCSISGSGPTVFALTTTDKDAQMIGAEMQAAFFDNGLESDLWISKVNATGAKII
ncbi:MAG TPA: homoserine kinase, partial [Patescibacteria group bacterium]|nr:homoserine kinase [Patescibacteria group bacterium]